MNVTATNVSLNSYGGTVGRITSSVPILTTDLQSGILSDTQKLELALAGQRGDATKIAGGFSFRVIRPIVLDVSGKLVVNALKGVAVAEPSGNLPLASIYAHSGDINLAATGSIINAPGGSGITANLSSTSTTIYSRSGTIGTMDSPIQVPKGSVIAGGPSAGNLHINAPNGYTTEAPPLRQPDAPGDPEQPQRQDTDRVDLTPSSVTSFTLGGTVAGTGAGLSNHPASRGCRWPVVHGGSCGGDPARGNGGDLSDVGQ